MTNVEELRNLVEKFKDKKLLYRAIENSLYNASQFISTESIKPNNHRYKNRTGNLGASVKVDVSKLSSQIFIDLIKAPYGLYQYEGTKSHMIKPTTKKSLSFVVGNQRYFSKGHKVKGIKRDRFILKTFNRKRSIFSKMMATDIIDQIEDYIK